MTYEIITHEDLQKFRLQLLKNHIRHGSAISQRVAEKFGGEKDARYLSWHASEFTNQRIFCRIERLAASCITNTRTF